MDNNFNLEEKDIYKLLNYVNLKEEEFEQGEDISSLEKERIKKKLNQRIKGNRKFKALKYGAIVAAISLVSIIGIGTVNPAFAKDIPVLSTITQVLNEKFGFYGDYDKYSQIINKPVTSNGVTLTINGVMADDSKIIITYTIKSEKKIDNLETACLSRFLMINGNTYGSIGSSAGKYTDPLTYVGIEEIDTEIPKNSNIFNIQLNVDDIGGVKGTWDFAFSASKDELAKKSIVFNPNMKVEFPDSSVNINKVVFSPIDTTIFLSGTGKNVNVKRRAAEGMFDYSYWIAYDDKGIELIPKGLGGGSFDTNKNTFTSQMSYQKTNNIPQYITIIPCKIIPSAGGGVEMENGKETTVPIETKQAVKISKDINGQYPIVLKQGSMGKITVNEVKTENGKTTVKYTAEGKAPYFQAESLWIEDENGKLVDYKSYDIRKDSQKPNEFVREFEALDPGKKYIIYTNDFSNVEFREDLKFTIKLNK